MRRGKTRNGLLPSSLRIISSCLKTVTANAGNVASTVRSAGASVAATISAIDGQKEQVLWAGFDKLELDPASFKHVLLLGYANGFQVLDVEDASNICELVSMREGPVTFLQMLPISFQSEPEGFKSSHPLLLVVTGDEGTSLNMVQSARLIKECSNEHQSGKRLITPTIVRFYSFKSHCFVHNLRFRSAVFLVRCSSHIVAVALAAQIYCFDAVTLESKFNVLTYPLQGAVGVNTGYGPMAIGPRWLAYTSNSPLLSNTGRLSPQNLTPSPGVSPSTSPGSGSLVARYAMESSKQLAAGILNLSDMGYKTFSKYYQELVPDGSSFPLSSSSARINGRFPSAAHTSDADNAGMVVVKDFVSMEIIAQFRAHTSPISSLCFDPSGTLLVTASVNGHNINVFRIMPTKLPNNSYDWSSSHVHLYKLYRGLTSAVIHDICFSHYSQWVAIVSSRGTCHIFTLSPFGGDASLQLQSPCCNGSILAPNLTTPWWSASSLIKDQHCFPPPLTLSVISRIKNCNSGWLNTVSSVTASAAGKISVPSGAIAVVFHNSINNLTSPDQTVANSLEHLLVYSPSGHLIQYELVPSPELESHNSISRSGSAPLLQFQDEELHVNAEPVQWWDVCRKSNWPEREQSIPRAIFDNEQNAVTFLDTCNLDEIHTSRPLSSTEGSKNEPVKAHENPHGYLSNAEVQVCSGRISVLQKSKICFFMMVPSINIESKANNNTDGEIEIEKLASHEIEIRRKDVLPVFKNSHLVPGESGVDGRKYQNSTSNAYESVYLLINDASSSEHYKPVPFGSGSGNDKNSQRKFSFIDDAFCSNIVGANCKASILNANDGDGQLIKDDSCTGYSNLTSDGFELNADGVCTRWPCEAVDMHIVSEHIADSFIQRSNLTIQHDLLDERMVSSPILYQMSASAMASTVKLASSHSNRSLMENAIINGFISSTSNSSSSSQPAAMDEYCSKEGTCSEIFNISAPALQFEPTEASGSKNSVEFTQHFNEGYCKVSKFDDCCKLTEAAADADSSSSHFKREKQENGEDDDLVGVFSFSEEG